MTNGHFTPLLDLFQLSSPSSVFEARPPFVVLSHSLVHLLGRSFRGVVGFSEWERVHFKNQKINKKIFSKSFFSGPRFMKHSVDKIGPLPKIFLNQNSHEKLARWVRFCPHLTPVRVPRRHVSWNIPQ